MDTTVIIAISIIALGFVILIGLAVWLTLDRQRRSRQTSALQPPRQSGPQTAHQPPARASASAAPAGPAGARPTPVAQSAPAEHKSACAPPDSVHSGEYPAAALYDQTMLPAPPRRRARKTE